MRFFTHTFITPLSLAFILLVVPSSLVIGCSGGKTAGSSINSNHKCDAGQVNVEGVCRVVCDTVLSCDFSEICNANGICMAPQDGLLPPRITSVNGDGSVDGTTSAEGLHGANHIQQGLVIKGYNLAGAMVALAAVGGSTEDYPLLTVRSGANDTKLFVDLPVGLLGGQYVLTVSNQSGAAETAVYVLQGEKGKDGVAGNDGAQGETGPIGLVGPSGDVGPRPDMAAGGGLLGDGSTASPMAVDFGTVAKARDAGRFFEAEDIDVSGTSVVVGLIDTDATASAGSVRITRGSSGDSGRVLALNSGNVSGHLGMGRVLVKYRAKVTSVTTTNSSLFASFNCSAIRAGAGITWTSVGGSRELKVTDFPGDLQWLEVVIRCDFLPDDIDQAVGVDRLVAGVTDLSIDYISITPDYGFAGYTRVTQCTTINGSDLMTNASSITNSNPLVATQYQVNWNAALCSQGVPRGNCVGFYSKGVHSGDDEDWRVLLPGESGNHGLAVNGGMNWWVDLGQTASDFVVASAVYMCDQ